MPTLPKWDGGIPAVRPSNSHRFHRFACTLFRLPRYWRRFVRFSLSFAKLLGLDILMLPKQNTSGVGSIANATYYDTVIIDFGRGIRFQTLAGFLDGLEA